MKKSVLLFVLYSMCLLGCNMNRIYENHEGIPEFVWDKKNVVEFVVSISDPEHPYCVLIAVRHADVYPFVDLPVILQCSDPEGEIFKDSFNLQLRDEDANWLAECMGQLCDLEIPVIENMVFKEAGDYVFKVSLNSEDEKIPLIMEIGLVVEKNISE